MTRIITLTILIATLVLGCNTKVVSQKKPCKYYYSVVSMQINNLKKFNEYRQKTKKAFQSAGGNILRDFDIIGKPKGPMQYGEVNRVSLIEFSTATGFKRLSDNPEYKKFKSLLKNSTRNLKVMSGSTRKPYSAIKGELFILKISNYKKQDGQAQKIAKAINQKLEKNYGFYNDTLFRITKLKGLARADDIGIFLYKNASDQQRLYKDKATIESIGKFNRTHLDSFVYLTLRAIK